MLGSKFSLDKSGGWEGDDIMLGSMLSLDKSVLSDVIAVKSASRFCSPEVSS